MLSSVKDFIQSSEMMTWLKLQFTMSSIVGVLAIAATLAENF
jgi:hypothetical protein